MPLAVIDPMVFISMIRQGRKSGRYYAYAPVLLRTLLAKKLDNCDVILCNNDVLDRQCLDVAFLKFIPDFYWLLQKCMILTQEDYLALRGVCMNRCKYLPDLGATLIKRNPELAKKESSALQWLGAYIAYNCDTKENYTTPPFTKMFYDWLDEAGPKRLDALLRKYELTSDKIYRNHRMEKINFCRALLYALSGTNTHYELEDCLLFDIYYVLNLLMEDTEKGNVIRDIQVFNEMADTEKEKQITYAVDIFLKEIEERIVQYTKPANESFENTKGLLRQFLEMIKNPKSHMSVQCIIGPEIDKTFNKTINALEKTLELYDSCEKKLYILFSNKKLECYLFLTYLYFNYNFFADHYYGNIQDVADLLRKTDEGLLKYLYQSIVLIDKIEKNSFQEIDEKLRSLGFFVLDKAKTHLEFKEKVGTNLSPLFKSVKKQLTDKNDESLKKPKTKKINDGGSVSIKESLSPTLFRKSLKTTIILIDPKENKFSRYVKTTCNIL